MNVASDPWVPVTDCVGQPRVVSLRQVFAEGEALQDLAVRPHERIALMRLLICVAQAAVDNPAGIEDEKVCAATLPTATARYLDAWQGSFGLFHPEKPFLQFSGLTKLPQSKTSTKKSKKKTKITDETNSENAASKLDFALATGSNVTLFDHLAATDESRAFDAARLVIMLLTFQCFSPGGTIGKANWHGDKRPGGGGSCHAPCTPSAMLHAFIRRGNLLKTIHANLLTRATIARCYRKNWGRPVWEQMPKSFQDVLAINNATTTYLGRLLPLSRAILLRPNGKDLILANGLDYPTPPEFPPEPTATLIKKRDDSGFALVGAGHKALWRELPALVVKRRAGEQGGPLALDDLASEEPFDLWVGALVTDGKNASILDAVEGVCHVPARMLNGPVYLTYDANVKESERVASQLASVCKTYRRHLELKPNPKRQPEEAFALRYYWSGVEHQCLPLLYAYLHSPDDGSDATKAQLGRWRAGLWHTARESFNASCANETPRQRRAHALAVRELYSENKKRGRNKREET